MRTEDTTPVDRPGRRVPPDLGRVQETLLIPLYGRAKETRRGTLISDPKAVEIVEAVDYDFSKFDGARSLIGATVRTLLFDNWVRAFLGRSPEGTVVELGAGLNTRFERLDNGRARWFELDLPDAMALRRRFFAETERREMIAASVLDPAWVERVRRSRGPHLFVAEAVLIYLTEAEVRRVLALVAEAFPEATLAMDTGTRWMIANQHKHDIMKKMAARMQWACDHPRDVEGWGLGWRLVESRAVMDVDPEIRRRLPGAWRYLLPVARVVFRRWIEAYRLNLFQREARVEGEG